MLRETALEAGHRIASYPEKNEIMGSVDRSSSTLIPLLNIVFLLLLIRGAWMITVQPFELEIVS